MNQESEARSRLMMNFIKTYNPDFNQFFDPYFDPDMPYHYNLRYIKAVEKAIENSNDQTLKLHIEDLQEALQRALDELHFQTKCHITYIEKYGELNNDQTA